MGFYDRQYYRDDSQMSFGYGGSARSAVVTLIIINVAIFFIDAFTGQGGGRLMDALALESNWFRQPWKFWQLLSHGFGHSPLNGEPGIWHVFFNMLGLFMFGVPVEQKYGKSEFFRIYLSAIVFSGLVWVISVSFQGRPITLYGASGAVTAIVILMALNFPFREVLLFGIVPIQIWLLGTIYVLFDLYGSMAANSQVAYVAHLGGAAFAALYFFLHWNFSALERWKRLLPFGRPRLRVHRPSAEERLQQEADHVLEKIHQSGEASLTRRERKTLERYSQHMRERRKGNN